MLGRFRVGVVLRTLGILASLASPLLASPLLASPLLAQRVSPAASSPSGALPPIPFPADSARADQAAFESLPAPLRTLLDVRRALAPDSAAAELVCVPLSTTSDGSRRQRVQGRIDGLGLVVFARVTREGALARVEFVRRTPNGGQRGFTWDSEGDVTTAMEWPAGSTQAESYPIPRGGPIPRAVRGLARIMLTWRCPGS